MPGTFSFLGVRTPGTDITTSYFHFGGFNPDERAIGLGVRAMAGWLADARVSSGSRRCQPVTMASRYCCGLTPRAPLNTVLRVKPSL
jgi:hypothetical protein